MVSNHLGQQQQYQTNTMQNPKYVPNAVNPHTVNHNHTNPNAIIMKTSAQVNNNNESMGQVITLNRLNDLAREIDPSLQFDEEVEETMVQITDDFIDTIMDGACRMAKHRHVNTCEVKDVQIYIERALNMWLPGFGTDELRPYKRAAITEAHKQRLALIRRALKKY